MNVAVINIKDLFRYILKGFIIIFILFFLVGILKKINILKEETLKNKIKNSANVMEKLSFVKCLDLTIPLIGYNNENNIDIIITNNSILAMGAGILGEKIYKTDLVINENELTSDDREELEKQIEELPETIVIENVEQNNIKAQYTSSYGSVQINNQSDYQITEDMLIPDEEITNKKDIFIYHTHTCESYTASPRI